MQYRLMRNSVIAFGMIIAFLMVMIDSGIRYDGLKKEMEVLRAQVNSMNQKTQNNEAPREDQESIKKLHSLILEVVQRRFDFYHPILMTQKNINPGIHTRHSWGNFNHNDYSFKMTPQQWIRLPQDDWRYHQFNSCALVGSDDALNYRNYGEEIDSHEVIFRMKEAPTIGYEKFVGRKTHYRLAYAPGDMKNPFPEWVWENDERVLYMPTYNNVEGYWYPSFNFTTTNSFLMEPNFAIYANSLVKVNPWMTTGWLGFVLTFHVCEHLDIYGFSEHATSYKRYYSPELKQVFHSKHEEESMMKLFDQLGVIRWRK